ncbi:hypothetical protein BN903_22 [Halorubrum sp. AJ67]|nr:hypothetical protein BN903_22 [Halorubrum sp. AJ67]
MGDATRIEHDDRCTIPGNRGWEGFDERPAHTRGDSMTTVYTCDPDVH